MITIPVYNTQGKEVSSLEIDDSIFEGVINTAAIYQAINAYRANQRKGLASTKTRGEVSGGGKKPWKQKGTGRARVGSIRSPLWRHGGVVFGPHPRDFSVELPKKIKDVALKSALFAKLKEDNFVVLEDLSIDSGKTKDAVKVFSNLKINLNDLNVLLLLEKADDKLKRSLHNIDQVNMNLAKNTNVYEVLSAQKLIITKDGLQTLTERMKK